MRGKARGEGTCSALSATVTVLESWEVVEGKVKREVVTVKRKDAVEPF